MDILIAVLSGMLIGLILKTFIFREKNVGSLKVDQSDQDSGPYLFLELNHGGMDAIHRKHYVRLRVEWKDYISHK